MRFSYAKKVALSECPECAGTISDRAQTCPHCGFPLQLQSEQTIEIVDFAAQFPHPGPLPQIPSHLSLAQKFGKAGTLAGRHIDEIISVVGPPNSQNPQAQGLLLCQWMSQGGIFTKLYHVALIFDSKGICGGVTHESSI